MSKVYYAMGTLLGVSVIIFLFLFGLTGDPVWAAEGARAEAARPGLQPSPRPTSALPTIGPTPEPPPTAEPPTPEPPPPTSKPQPQPQSEPATSTPTPTPQLLPNSGGSLGGGIILALGVCLLLLGLVLRVVKLCRV